MKLILKRLWMSLGMLIAVGVFTLIVLAWYGSRLGDSYVVVGSVNRSASASVELQKTRIERGAYLVKIANCMTCHTARGGVPFAGGRVLQTEFGQFVTPNITPDKQNGIGSWNAEDFWNALHNGKAKDGRLLYPAFPYINYTHISRDDADAMFAYLQTQAASAQTHRGSSLAFPYNQAFGLAVWRALYFQPGELSVQVTQSPEWNRGAYLVRGLAHCSACHSTRNRLGANGGSADFSGGEMGELSWYAPSLMAKHELDLTSMPKQELANLLQHGVNKQSSVSGPMAEVVRTSLQYLSQSDALAMATYLQGLPQQVEAPPDLLDQAIARTEVSKEQMLVLMQAGESIYRTNCLDCHGSQGEGKAGIYPALQGNLSLQTKAISNPIRIILAGGFAPATKGNPRPYSMPPFAPFLNDNEVALVLTYTRNAWGNRGKIVTAAEVNSYRTASID